MVIIMIPNPTITTPIDFGAITKSSLIRKCHFFAFLAFESFFYNSLFSGSIPSFTAFLGRREAITLSNNLLTGTIPAKIPEQTDLFGGSVNPADFRMATLDISQNLISGTIPPLVGFIPSLKYVDYSSNDLTGTLPQTLGRFGLMTKVEYISVANNQFEGPIITLGYPETTRHIDVSNNQKLEGGFPSFLLDYKALEYLDLSNNDFKGQLPQNIGNLRSLLYFGAKDCGLSGSIPPSLGSLGQVTQVDISENALSSSIPSALGTMNSLRVFQANSNALTGSIPSEFASLKNLGEYSSMKAFSNGILSGRSNRSK